MSVLLSLRLDDTTVLATDSRVMDNAGEYVLSDAAEKIFEIAPGVFYGWSGYGALAVPQVEIARELAKTAVNMRDLHAFADSLDALSTAPMVQLLSTLAVLSSLNLQKYEAELAGTAPFHAYVLAGLSDGKPGFLAREFYLTNGRIGHREADGFRLPPGNNFTMFTTHSEPIADIIPMSDTWANGPVVAAEGLVDHIRRVQPLVGGPTQLVVCDKTARWVHRPVTPPPVKPTIAQLAIGVLNAGVIYSGQVNATQINSGILNSGVINTGSIAASQITAGTITASVTLTSPTLLITAGTVTVEIDTANLVKISNASSGEFTQVADGLVIVKSTVTNQEVDITPSSVLLQSTGHLASLSPTGFGSIGGSTGFTGTLAAAIAAGKSVVGGIIVN